MFLWCLISFSSRVLEHPSGPRGPAVYSFASWGKFLLFLQTSVCSDSSVLVWSTLPVCHSAGNGGDSTTGFVQVPAHRWDKLRAVISGPAPAHRNRVPVRLLASCVGSASSMMIALNLGVHWYTRFCRRSITGSGMAQLGDGVTDNPGGAVLLVGFCWDTLQGSYWTSSQSSLHSYGYRCQWGGMECCAVGSALSAGARAGQSSWILHPKRRRESPLPLESYWEFLVPCYLFISLCQAAEVFIQTDL